MKNKLYLSNNYRYLKETMLAACLGKSIISLHEQQHYGINELMCFIMLNEYFKLIPSMENYFSTVSR